MKIAHVRFKEIYETACRFDASPHLSDGIVARRLMKYSPYPLTTLDTVSERIWHAGRWRRVYVSNPKKGITLLGSAAILKTELSSEKLISLKYTEDIEDKKLQKGWVLISCSGTIGKCVFSTEQHAEKLASQDVIRLKPNNILKSGVIYAYLASRYGYSLLTQGTFGSVIQHIEPQHVANIPIPLFPVPFQEKIDKLIQTSAQLRDDAERMLVKAHETLLLKAGLRRLTESDYEYFGSHSYGRKVSCFVVNRKNINTTTINAFNYSERVKAIKQSIACQTKPIKAILKGGNTFSTGSFTRMETTNNNGIMLINQSDIFDTIIKGKYIYKNNVKVDNLVEYGEVLIAGVGTLAESESFCRVVFANEDLVGQLVSSEFIRMKTIDELPSGYLYVWLSTDYGFRFLRNIHSGTKLCRPIPSLLLDLPVPIIDSETMHRIDTMVKSAHTKRHKANKNELKAILLLEEEMKSWYKY